MIRAKKQGLNMQQKLTFISWNVNGIRAVDKKEALKWIDETEVDFLCLQEIKAEAVRSPRVSSTGSSSSTASTPPPKKASRVSHSLPISKVKRSPVSMLISSMRGASMSTILETMFF
jgi:hypothetical protein